MTSVVLVEDHPMFREGLRATLDLSGVDVLAAVATAADGRRAVMELRPDVAVLDLELPDGNGIELTAQVCRDAGSTAVLVLTSHDDDARVRAALAAGARGFLAKAAGGEEIARAVETVAAGGGAFSGAVVTRLAAPATASGAAFPHLTGREREVLELIAAGHSNAYIADQFVLSLKTVRNYVSAVLTKLGVATRAEAVVLARQAGLGRAASDLA